MRVRMAPLLLGIALAGCSSQADTQLEGVKSARSVLGEWALVEEQAQAGHAPSPYTEQMREMTRAQLKTLRPELKGRPQAQNLIDAMRNGSPDAGALHRAQDALDPLEKQLESS